MSRQIAASIPAVIKRRFPCMFSAFSGLNDPRKGQGQGRQYDMSSIMLGGMSVFLFKTGSRNQLDNKRKDGFFGRQYSRLFNMELPHQDTVKDVLCELPNAEVERVKMNLTSELFEQKWLRKYRLLGKYRLVAVDATGIVSFDKPHCEHCLTKKSKNGKITYFHYVLEAKLVTRDGHAISMASEWIENPTGEFDKQDCERKAFIRLAEKLKKQFSRLPICILADGLYPYENSFKICEEYGWKFIFVLQDKSLKTVQEELTLTRRSKPVLECYTTENGWRTKEEYRFQTDIEYREKYTLNWIQAVETRNKMKTSEAKTVMPEPETSNFEYVTNIEPEKKNVREIAFGGRLRWKIENEGFNAQKCGDYELEHKYCRKSYNGMKNYYTLLQIAHAINQLIEKGKLIKEILKRRPKESVHNLWENLRGYMVFVKPEIIYVNSG